MTAISLEGLQEIYRRGQFLDVYKGLEERLAGSLPRDMEEAVLAIRTCSQLRLMTRAGLLTRQLWREHPDSLTAWTYKVYALMTRQRMVRALEMVRDPGRPAPAGDHEEVRWRSAKASIYITFRDFATAAREISAGMEEAPDSPWVYCDLIWLRFREDRLDEALSLCRAGMERFGHYTPLREVECFLLHELNDRERALAAYQAAHEEFQSPSMSGGYANCLMQHGQPAKAREILEQNLAEYWMYGRRMREGYHYLLTRICRMLGDDAAALAHARQAGEAGEDLVAGLEEASGEVGGRVQLDVPFVRQDHLTCAPATMASVLAYCGIHVDQRDIAAQITYDGTPDFRQLQWVRDQGLSIRFFQFEPESARQLLDRGLPFTLSTRFPMNAHLQGVIGYDRKLRSFILREPGQHALHEVPEKELVKILEPRGGTCSIILPKEWEEKLPPGKLPLEDETMTHVLFHQALHERRLEEAEKQYDLLMQLPPCPLRWDVQRAKAFEHSSPRQMVEVSREQLAAFPKDAYCAFRLATELSDTDLWEEHRRFLEEQCSKPDCSPYLKLKLAERLLEHAPELPRAERLARTCVRSLGENEAPIRTLASIAWENRERRGYALELFRIASCLAPHDENVAMAYFRACHMLDRAEEGLAYLRERFSRLGRGNSAPAGTLAQALDMQHRKDEAIAVLEEGLRQHDDPWTRGLLFDQLLASGRLAEARELLDASETRMRPLPYWHSRYRLEVSEGKSEAALAALEQALTYSPSDAQVQQDRLRLLVQMHGFEQAKAEALRLAQAHQSHPWLLRSVYDFLFMSGENEDAEVLLRRVIDQNPEEHWLKGLLARHLVTTERPKEALELCEFLQEVYPNSTALWNDMGMARALVGDPEGAFAAYERSLGLDPNQPQALYQMLQNAGSRDQAEAGLRFVMELFRQRAPESSALTEFLRHSGAFLSEAERRSLLEELAKEYPGNPHPGEALCSFLFELKDFVGVEGEARRLMEQFPWRELPRLYLFRALVRQERTDEARKVLQDLCERDPRSAHAFVELGSSYEDAGDLERAEKVYQQGLLHNPGHAPFHGCLAALGLQRGKTEEGLAQLVRACELDRGYEWAFDCRVRLLCQLGRGDEARAVARELVEESPAWAFAHGLHAYALTLGGLHEESVVAMRKALHLDPRMGNTRNELVETLGNMGRFDEARQVLQEGFNLLGKLPELEALGIWLLRQEGKHAQALTEMQALLDSNPDSRSCWITYLSWLEEDGRSDEILRIHRKPPEALADFHVLHGYAADSMLDRGDEAGAEKALRRACEIEPDYVWALNSLASLLHRQKRYEEEYEVYRQVQDPDSVSEVTASLIIRNAVALGKQDRALRFFPRVLRERDADAAALRGADEAVRSLGRDVHKKALEMAFEADPSGHAQVNAVLLHAFRGEKREFFTKLNEIDDQAMLEEILSEARQTSLSNRLSRWVLEHVQPPVESVHLWGLVGLILVNGGRDEKREAIRYMFDDYRRPGAQGWMLANLAECLRSQKRYADMKELCEYALTLPRDDSRWWHRMFLAHERYLAGDYQACLDLAKMPVAAYFRTKLEVHVLHTLARIQMTKERRKKRRILVGSMREFFNILDSAAASGEEVCAADYHPDLMWKAIPCAVSMLMCLGRVGRWIARLRYR